MTTFIIKTDWIKEVRDGRNACWNYDYKEYIFNDNYTNAYSIRIPQGTYGIKAMEYSNGQGISNEYQRVFLDNNGVITKLFEIDSPCEKDRIINALKAENAKLTDLNEKLTARLSAVMVALWP